MHSLSTAQASTSHNMISDSTPNKEDGSQEDSDKRRKGEKVDSIDYKIKHTIFYILIWFCPITNIL